MRFLGRWFNQPLRVELRRCINMELMNCTQWVIAVLQESFESTLFTPLVPAFCGQPDLCWWSEVRFCIRVFQRSLQKSAVGGFWSMKVAVLTVSHRCHRIVYAVSAARLVQKWPLRGFGGCGFSCLSSSFLFPPPLLISECLPSCFN